MRFSTFRKGRGNLIAHLPNVFFASQQFLLTPFGEHAKFGSHETYLPRSPPDDCWGPTEGDELVQLLWVASRLEEARLQSSRPLTITDRWTHFSTNISSSSVSGI